jgi:divalent metal cation (Fe/Co/Zn/Cd) transporter
LPPSRSLIFLAVGLLIFTAVYNVFEGIIAIYSGLAAGSIVLLAFGADSYLEVLAAGAVLWRLSFTDEEAGERAEARALRVIGVTFLVLAGAVVFQSLLALAGREGAEESRLGIILLAASLLLMPVLSFTKLWTAARVKMPALAAEARETIACSYLSLTAFVGLVATAALGWWWLDATVALLLVPWLVREGLEAVRGEACYDGSNPCFCRQCFFGLRDCAPGDTCLPACC